MSSTSNWDLFLNDEQLDYECSDNESELASNVSNSPEYVFSKSSDYYLNISNTQELNKNKRSWKHLYSTYSLKIWHIRAGDVIFCSTKRDVTSLGLKSRVHTQQKINKDLEEIEQLSQISIIVGDH